MNHSDNNDFEKIVLVVVVLALLGFGLWISNTFDVPGAVAAETAFKVGMWGLLIIGIGALHAYKSTEFNSILYFSPFMISLFWCALLPVLDYKAGIRENFPVRIEPDWYGYGLWQFAIFMLINITGYGAIYYWKKYKSADY